VGLPGFSNPANRAPQFTAGNTMSRRSGAAGKALKMARKFTPAAIQYAGRVLNDDEAEPRLRLKAAEIILLHGMPKGDAHKRALESIDGGVNSLRVEFVSADGTTVSFEQAGLPPHRAAPAPAMIEVPFAEISASKVEASMDKSEDDDAS
jgi:hypothetical protein